VISVHEREVTWDGRKRLIRVRSTPTGFVLQVWHRWSAKLGQLQSLERRRYYYGPDAEARAVAEMDSYFDEARPETWP
jgi:hypothetical protein